MLGGNSGARWRRSLKAARRPEAVSLLGSQFAARKFYIPWWTRSLPPRNSLISLLKPTYAKPDWTVVPAIFPADPLLAGKIT
jgi:hypothetical protein